jgi:hypothetical protein
MTSHLSLGREDPELRKGGGGMRRRLVIWLPVAAAVAAALANAMDWGP